MSEALETLEEMFAVILKQLSYSPSMYELEELSIIHGETPVYMAFFIAKAKQFSEKKSYIRYINFNEEICTKEYNNESGFLLTFIDNFLRLQVSKSGRGRDDLIAVLKNYVRSALINQIPYETETMGDEPLPKQKIRKSEKYD